MSAALDNAGIGTLTALASTTPDGFLEVIWPVVRSRTTRRKAINISKKVVAGAYRTVDVLRRNGVDFWGPFKSIQQSTHHCGTKVRLTTRWNGPGIRQHMQEEFGVRGLEV